MNLHPLIDDPSPPPLFNSASSLGATVTLTQLHVLDASHQPVANATIVSETGTDWTTTVPEPDVESSCAAALGLFAVQRRLRVIS